MKIKNVNSNKRLLKGYTVNIEKDIALLLMAGNTIHPSNCLYLHCGPSIKVE